MTSEEAKVKTFDILKFVADNAGLSIFELIEKAYNMGVSEQEPIFGKIRAEIIDTLYVDSLIFGELIDFKNGKISADDVIEEFNRVTRTEVLQIIEKYKEESEG